VAKRKYFDGKTERTTKPQTKREVLCYTCSHRVPLGPRCARCGAEITAMSKSG
jgi:DNA-directed RNA polymerase subunit RPC12/RpoP